MSWRYQPVEIDSTSFVMIEVHLDTSGKLESWGEDDGITPFGQDHKELRADLCRLYVDSYCWKPVPFKELRAGMTFESAVSPGEREEIARFAEGLADFLKGRTQGPGQ